MYKLSTFLLSIKNKKILYFLLSGCILALAMNYPEEVWFLVFVFLVPVLFFTNTYTQENAKDIFTRMFLFSFVFVLFATFYFLEAFPLDWMGIHGIVTNIIVIGGVWASFAVVMSIPLGLWLVCVYRLRTNNDIINALTASFLWVFLEYCRSWFVALGIYSHETLLGPHHTYYSLGYTLSSAPVLRELIPVGGLYLGSFVIILINYFFYTAFFCFRNNKKSIIFLGVCICIIIGGSYFSMRSIRENDVNLSHITTTIINTNSEPAKTREAFLAKSEDVYSRFELIKNDHGVTILPEELNLANTFLDVDGIHENINTSLNTSEIIIGSSPNKEHYGKMFFFNTQKKTVEYIRKQLLMPVGEYGIGWMGYILSMTHTNEELDLYKKSRHIVADRYEKRMLYSSDIHNDVVIGGSLCSENISPYIYSDMTRRGATVLVNSASHRPFHGSQLLERQTIAVNMTRALENGRYFVTASNHGRSSVITDKGIIQKISTSTETFSYFNEEIYLKKYSTPYVRYGDYIVIIATMYLLSQCIRYMWVRKTTPIK